MSEHTLSLSNSATPKDDSVPESSRAILWGNVLLAALMMVATLPGRTQGLGLITEPLLADLQLDRIDYASINLWATLLGAILCLPAGKVLDRWGLRWVSTAVIVLLAAVVWLFSRHHGAVGWLFLWVLLTRALGQSALSVASITTVGKSCRRNPGLGMGVYAVVLSVLFAVAFVVVGSMVSAKGWGWRAAWSMIAATLLFGVAPLVAIFLREPPPEETSASESTITLDSKNLTLGQALSTATFWIFAGATALFGLVSSGLGLFNEAVLAERGFDQKTYQTFLAVTTLFALAGQFVCGSLSTKHGMAKLLGIALLLYALGLVTLPLLQNLTQLWIFAAVFGIAAGFITVIFFAIWGQEFGRVHLGRIQGAAQMLTVLASAVGPLLFAECHRISASYAPLLLGLAPVVFLFAVASWRLRVNAPRRL